jgi:thioesterase domain-containing protein
MSKDELRRYMFARIPLSEAMGVDIVAATAESVALSAPLARNVNHQGTVFGGSASAVALLSAWALLHLRLTREQLDAGIVVKKYTMTYDRPMSTDFTATTTISNTEAWSAFLHALRRRGRARISAVATLRCNGEQTGQLQGEFVALTGR